MAQQPSDNNLNILDIILEYQRNLFTKAKKSKAYTYNQKLLNHVNYIFACSSWFGTIRKYQIILKKKNKEVKIISCSNAKYILIYYVYISNVICGLLWS